LVQRTVPTSVLTGENQQAPTSDSRHTNVNINANNNNNNNISSDLRNIIQQFMGGLGDMGPTMGPTRTTPSSQAGQLNVEETTRVINENDIRSRIRNIKRFLRMAEARLNRLQVVL
jgi:hypothetical protein